MTREAVRKFGVELEGYFETNLEGEYFFVDGKDWDIKEDGSLGSGEDTEECEACDGDGYIEPLCSNLDCSGGNVSFMDSHGNEYDVECRSCGGSGEGAPVRCIACDGSGEIETSGEYGLEVVSPPITNLDSITEVYEKMHEKGWTVKDRAGLHIHVDAGDLTPKDFYKVLLLMTAIEPIIFAISDIYRLNGTGYCQAISGLGHNVNNILRRDYERMNAMNQVCFSNDRYTALNFRAFSKHGTIEFRYFSPQTEASEVINRVELVTRIVDFAKYASLEQTYVAYKKIFECNVFNECCDILQELLQLPFDLKSLKKSEAFETLSRVEIGNLLQYQSSLRDQSQPVQVDLVV